MKVQFLYVDVGIGVEVIIKLTVVIEMEADVEVYEEVDKEVANVVGKVVSCRKSLNVHNGNYKLQKDILHVNY